MDACITESTMFDNFIIHELTINERAKKAGREGDAASEREIEDYSNLLLQIGDGRDLNVGDEVMLPIGNIPLLYSQEELVQRVYGAIAEDPDIVEDTQYMMERCILAPTNAQCDVINKKVAALLPEREVTTYLSANWCCDPRDSVTTPPENLMSIKEPGLPSHKLELQVIIVFYISLSCTVP